MQFSMNFKSLWLGWNISLLSKRRTLVVSTFLSMRNKFACFLTWEYMLQDLIDSWKAFLLPVDCGSVSLAKVAEILEEIVVGWQEVRWISQMEQNSIVQFVNRMKCWLCTAPSSLVLNWAFLTLYGGCKHCWFWHLSSVCWTYFS